MRIIYIVNTLEPLWGDVKAANHLATRLIKMGVEYMFIVCKDSNVDEMYLQQGAQIERLVYRASIYPPLRNVKDWVMLVPRVLKTLVMNMRAEQKLLRLAKSFHPDIIHTNNSLISIGYHVAKRLGLPHVWHIREYGDAGFGNHYLFSKIQQHRRYRREMSYTICITKDIQRYNHLAGWDNSRVVYDGVLSEAQVTYYSSKKPYFLYVGRVMRGKGTLDLLEAYVVYSHMVTNPLPLHIAGSCPDSDFEIECRNVVENGNVQDKVCFIGVIKDILPLYQEAQALIVPSLAEGFGLITAEAMFSGCLVVGRDVAGTKEQFDNGVELIGEEIALRYSQQEQLVQHMIAITDAVERGTFTEQFEPMILRAQQVVQKLYTSECNAEQIYQFYQDILQS